MGQASASASSTSGAQSAGALTVYANKATPWPWIAAVIGLAILALFILKKR